MFLAVFLQPARRRLAVASLRTQAEARIATPRAGMALHGQGLVSGMSAQVTNEGARATPSIITAHSQQKTVFGSRGPSR